MRNGEFVQILSHTGAFGGTATYQAHLVEYFANVGCRIVVIDEMPHATIKRCDSETLARVEAMVMPLWSDRRISNEKLYKLSNEKVFSIVAISNPGILVKYFRYLMRLRKRDGSQVIVTLHSGMLTMTFRRKLLEIATSIALLGVDKVIYVSNFTKLYWESRFPWLRLLKNAVIPNGALVPSCDERHVRRSAPFTIGFVGRFEREKGVDEFCNVAKLSKLKGKDWKFVAFGDGVEIMRIRRLYSEYVSFMPATLNTKEIFCAIDILMICSKVENCPYVVLEAKGYGVPVISPRIGGMAEIVTKDIDGIFTNSTDSAEFLSAVEAVIGAYEVLSRNAKDSAKRFSVSVFRHNTGKFINA